MLVLFLLGKAVVRTPAARATVSRRALLTSGMVAGCTLPGAPTLAFADAEEDSAPPPPPGLQPLPSAFDFDVPFRGEPSAIKPFLGRASILVNVKFDDPETLEALPGLKKLLTAFAADGLHVLAFPTDQGWFEPDDSDLTRLKFKQVYDFGQYPTATVFDKSDLLGTKQLPLYAWLEKTLPNPWGVRRLVLDYEKFLIDASGQPLRRYPRKYPVELMEADVAAALAGEPLPPVTGTLAKAWEDAKREATKSEYAFKPGLNYVRRATPPCRARAAARTITAAPRSRLRAATVHSTRSEARPRSARGPCRL